MTTNVQDRHNMSKLYLVHLRPLGLHGIFLVVLSIQVAVVPSCHGTTRDIPGTLPLSYTTLPVPGSEKATVET